MEKDNVEVDDPTYQPQLTTENPKHFQCKECDFVGTSATSLYKHEKRMHNGKKRGHKCDKCKFITLYPGNLRIHAKTHENRPRTFKCDKCNYAATSDDFLRRHALTHATVKPFKCDKCNFASKHSSSLASHIKLHDKKRPFRCTECDASYAIRGQLNTHLKKHRDDIKRHRCRFCEREFDYASHLKRHENIHEGRKAYACVVCDDAFTRKDQLERHAKLHNEDKKFKCKFCDYASHLRYSVTQHELSHNDEKKYKCDECDYVTVLRSSLAYHVAIHKGDKRHKCSFCDSAFVALNSLKIHMRSHTGEKPYKCPRCNCAFRQSSNMRVHEASHKRKKQCDGCHGKIRRMYKCDKCEYEGKKRQDLVKHKRANHEVRSVFRKQRTNPAATMKKCTVRLRRLTARQLSENVERLKKSEAKNNIQQDTVVKQEKDPKTTIKEEFPDTCDQLLSMKKESTVFLDYVQIDGIVKREKL